MKKTAMMAAVCCVSMVMSNAYALECKPGEATLWVDRVEVGKTFSGFALAVGLKAQAPVNLARLKKDYYLEDSILTVGAVGENPGRISGATMVDEGGGSTCLEFGSWRERGDPSGYISEVARMDGTPPGVCITSEGSISSKLRVITIAGSPPYVSLSVEPRTTSNKALLFVFKEGSCPE